MLIELNRLNEYQESIYKAIEKFDKPPITISNIKIESIIKHPSLEFSVNAETPVEFDIHLVVNDEEYTIFADGWHEHYDLSGDPKELADYVLMQLITMLDGRIKLKITYAGKNPYRWEAFHSWSEGEWESLGVTGLLLYNYFGRRKTIEKINHKLEFQGYFTYD